VYLGWRNPLAQGNTPESAPSAAPQFTVDAFRSEQRLRELKRKLTVMRLRSLPHLGHHKITISFRPN
jgi:hypothetical protein